MGKPIHPSRPGWWCDGWMDEPLPFLLPFSSSSLFLLFSFLRVSSIYSPSFHHPFSSPGFLRSPSLFAFSFLRAAFFLFLSFIPFLSHHHHSFQFTCSLSPLVFHPFRSPSFNSFSLVFLLTPSRSCVFSPHLIPSLYFPPPTYFPVSCRASRMLVGPTGNIRRVSAVLPPCGLFGVPSRVFYSV